MVDSFTAENNRIVVVKNDKISFDTANPSISLFPASQIVLNDYEIIFPNLVSGILYCHRGPLQGTSSTVCETWSGLLPQEHGPNYGNYSPTASQFFADSFPIRRDLSIATLGTVPAGTTYLDVRARLTRVQSAPYFHSYQSQPIMFFPENEWINLPGGSCPVEYAPPLQRMFNVVLSGNNVLLYRYQSCANLGQIATSASGNNNNENSVQFGEQWGNYANSPAQWTTPCILFEQKGPDGNGNKRPPWGTTSTNSCATGSVVDYTARYLVDFQITPGRYQP